MAGLSRTAAEWEALRARQYGEERINLNPGTLGTPARAVGQAMAEFDARYRGWPLGQHEGGRAAMVRARTALNALMPLPRAVLGHGSTAQMSVWMPALVARFGNVRMLTSTDEHDGALYGPLRHPAFQVEQVAPERLVHAAAERRHDVVLASEITWTDGRRLPLAELRQAAGDAWLIADAAQVAGLDTPFADADMVLCSLHKWLACPAGTGATWLSERAAAELAAPVGAGHPIDLDYPLGRFEPSGAQDFARWAGVAAGLELAAEVGIDAARERTRTLGQQLAVGLAERLQSWAPEFMGPAGWQSTPAVAPGHVVVVRSATADPYPLYRRLDAAGAHLKCIKGDGRNQLRLGVPWYETEARIERALALVSEALGA